MPLRPPPSPVAGWALRPPLHTAEQLERFRACRAPLALWSAADHPSGVFRALPVVSRGALRLFAKKDKR